jgi:hypothetical protein
MAPRGEGLLLSAMQLLIHGNFEGAAQRQAYALVGAAAAIAAAAGPLLGLTRITGADLARIGLPHRLLRKERRWPARASESADAP